MTKGFTLPAKPVPKEISASEAAPKAQPMTLSRKNTLNKEIGMPKCGRPWKAQSKRSGIQKKFCPKSWTEKMDERRRMKALRDRVNEAQEKIKQQVMIRSYNAYVEKRSY